MYGWCSTLDQDSYAVLEEQTASSTSSNPDIDVWQSIWQCKKAKAKCRLRLFIKLSSDTFPVAGFKTSNASSVDETGVLFPLI